MKKLITATTMVCALLVGVAIEDADASSTYTVKSGDTLYGISQSHNLSVSELKSINDLSSNAIYPDQVLTVAGNSTEETASSSSSTYTVKSGDTLYRIALNHNTTVSQIKSLNSLSSDTIYPNQTLTVSGSGSSSSDSESSNGSSDSSNAEEEESSSQEVAREMTVESTAYTANCNGCSGVTATGIDLNANPDQKVIAVDPNVIPLGTEVYVEGYGTAVAGDTGGAINGNKIDVYFQDQSQAVQWGRQQVNIQILQ